MPARLLHLRLIICDEFSELKLKDEDACRVLPEHPEERTKEIGHWHGARSDFAPSSARFWFWYDRLSRGVRLSKAPLKPSHVALTLNQPVD
jgi:hypothetical protein